MKSLKGGDCASEKERHSFLFSGRQGIRFSVADRVP
jgi:hypothetical protein